MKSPRNLSKFSEISVTFPRNLSNSQEICQNSEKFLTFLLNFWEICQKSFYRAFSELGKPLVSEVPGASWGRPGASWERPGGVLGPSWNIALYEYRFRRVSLFTNISLYEYRVIRISLYTNIALYE